MVKKIALISLGCPKNHVDSEVLLGLLAQDGCIITSSLDEADVAVINTCAFIQAAVEESIETVLEAVQAKAEGRINTLIVTGCLPQRYGEEIAQSIPEVDFWTGTGDFIEIPRWLKKNDGNKTLIGRRPRYIYDHHTPRIITNTPHSACVKIAEGCFHSCAFCLIPQLRGRYRSRVMDSVIREVEQLVAGGVIEIILVAQDTTAYGVDNGKDRGLFRLLKELIKIEGLRWVRILYAYPHPDNFHPPLLEMIAGEERICSYLDIPIQHINDTILQRMGRKHSGKDTRELIKHIKKEYPAIHLRTTLMVGFPGEGEGEIRELLDFVREMEFTHLGVFTYSSEEGTKAARMKGRPSPEVAEERRARLMELQQGISWKRNKAMLGSIVSVLIDGVNMEPEGMLQGRTAFQAPEIDGVVHITKGEAIIGEIVPVKITQAEPYDLRAEITRGC